MDFKYCIYLFFIIMCVMVGAVYVLRPTSELTCINVTAKEYIPQHEQKTEFVVGGVIWPITSDVDEQYVLCLNNSGRLVVSEGVYNNATIGINCIEVGD